MTSPDPIRATNATPSTAPNTPALTTPAATAPSDDARRTHLSEDWLATIVGLTLLALVLAGVLGADVVP
jgi:hypothetical protein